MKRKKPNRSAAPLGFAMLLLFGAVAAGTAWYLAGKPMAVGSVAKVRVVIPKGSSPARAGHILQEAGVLRSAFVWERFVARGARIKPGTYDLSPAETPEQLLRRLTRGETATVRVTFPEGFTLRKIAARLKDRGCIADEDAFLELVTRHGARLSASTRLPDNLEGYLFPDTYDIPAGATNEEIAGQLVANFQTRVVQGRADRIRASGRTLESVVIVASMVEREARTDADRAKVAGVIYNRLRKHMRLEIDATIQYARGQHAARLLYRDLDIDSPYNTYRHAGLPPGPICCPGLPSIDAALAPEKSEFLFYVLGRDGKSHVFARTFAEHRANIARVRKP